MARTLTDEQLAAATDAIREGAVRRKVADNLGVTEGQLKSSLQRWRERYRRAMPLRDIGDIVELPPRPFAVPTAVNVVPIAGKAVTAVVLGDRQTPFHDPVAVKVARAIVSDVNPDILLDMGDGLDCWQISDYDNDPGRQNTLQDDIDAERIEMVHLADAAPRARRVRLEGNHEDRLRKLLWRLPGAAARLNQLRVVQQTLTIPYLLQMHDSGWEYISTEKQSRTPVLPKLITIHGHQLKGSTTVEGASARKAIQKYGRSCVVGHHHRAAVLARRDHNGQSFGIETGCLCLLDGQPYGVDFNWQQAVTVIEWTKDHRVMAVQQVMIRDGRAMWRGREIVAR